MALTAQNSSLSQLEHDSFDYEQENTMRTTVTHHSGSSKKGEAEGPVITGSSSNSAQSNEIIAIANNANASSEVNPCIYQAEANGVEIRKDRVESGNNSLSNQRTLLQPSQSSETKLSTMCNEGESPQPQPTQGVQRSMQQHREANSKSPPKPSRLAIPKATPYRAGSGERSIARLQVRTLNRLEVENAYLQDQNSSLNKDIQHCRQTVQALKNILAQKEDMIDKMKEEFRQAYLKTKFMENILAEQQNFSTMGSKEDWQFSRGFQGGQRTGYLVRQVEDDESSGEEDISDESESIDDEQDDMMDCEIGTDEDEDDEDLEDDDNNGASDDEGKYERASCKGEGSTERQVSDSGQRVQGLSLSVSSHASHMSLVSPNNDSSETTPLHLQPTTSHNNGSDGDQKAGTNIHHVIRRRPRLQLSTSSSDLTQSTLLPPMEEFKDTLAISSNGLDLSLTSSPLSSEPNSATKPSNLGNGATRQTNLCALRDSGHFQDELFSTEADNAMCRIKATELAECQPAIINPHFEFVCLSEPLELSTDEGSGDEESVAPVVDPVTNTSYEDSSQSNSLQHLGVSSPIELLTLLPCSNIEASTSSTTLMTGSTTSLEDSISGTRENGEEDGGRDGDAPPVGGNHGIMGSSGPSEYGMDEDRSESSLTTIITPLIKISDHVDTSYPQTASTDRSISSATFQRDGFLRVHGRGEDVNSQRSQLKNKGISFLVESPVVSRVEGISQPLGSRSSSKIESKVGLDRARGKTPSKSREEVAGVSILGTDQILTETTSIQASVASAVSDASSSRLIGTSVDSTDPLSKSTTMASGKQKNSAPFLSRVWSGLGKHVTGLFVGDRQSPDNTKSRKGTQKAVLDADRHVTTRPTSPTLDGELGNKKSSERIGIRRLGARSRSRPQLSSAVLVVATEGNAYTTA
ncbi:hypothetical protein BGX27_004790 [Mortierella sp. AM989]|nr:hypothetical protein BGX27_004790 [Mortierella sp. AM989]